MKHVIKRLDRGGDTEVAEWDPALKIEIKTAEEVFNEHRLGNPAKGIVPHAMYITPDPQKDSIEIKKFDPEQDIIARPPLVGG